MTQASKAATGIKGLDDILLGGFARGCLFLLEGSPGTGKTTIAVQFLLEGIKAQQRALYITLSNLRTAREAVAWTYGMSDRQYADLQLRT